MIQAHSRDLVAQAQAGNVEAVGELYDQHHEALFRYFWSKVGTRELAEDLTGDVFMRMLTALPRYRQHDVPFRAWLFGIARHRLVDHYRKEGGREFLPLEQMDSTHHTSQSDPAALAEHGLTMETVRSALAQLEEAQREVVSLRFLGGLSLQEVAAVMEKSESAIKALQHRGLTALRRRLAQKQVQP